MTQVHPSAVVDSKARLGADVEIGPYSVIGPGVEIRRGTRVMAHAVIDGHTTLGEECCIFPFASIGTRSQDLKYTGGKTFVSVGDRTTLREYVTVNAGTSEGETTRIGNDCLIMAYAHVAHTCNVGHEVIMANCATLGGHIVVEDQAILGGLSAVHQFVRVGRMCMVGGCTKVTQDCTPFMIVDGRPARVPGPNRIGLQRRGVSDDARRTLKQAYRLLYRTGLSTRQALERIEADLNPCDELRHLCAFIRESRRGIVR